MKYKTYLFDFGGTLVDSMPSYAAAMLKILDDNHIQYESDLIKTITPLGYVGTARYYIEHLGLSLSEQETVDRMKQYAYDEYAYRIKAKAHVPEVLKSLKEQGADLHVLTASPHTVLDVCLARLGLTELFTNIWSCDDFGTTKADPCIYQMAASRIGKPIEQILFLDDNCNADKTAASAGMKVCGVYDLSSAEFTEEIKRVSDHYINDFEELLSL